MLHVHADDPEALERALEAGADALLLALPEQVEATLSYAVRDFLRTAELLTQRPLLFVRLPSIEMAGLDAALGALMVAEPDGVVLGRCRGGHDVQHLGVKLSVQEAEYGLTDGETPVIAEAGSTARALFAMASYCDASPRLMGLLWEPYGLAADLCAASALLTGRHAPLSTARHLLLIAARAADVAAIDGPSESTGDALRTECDDARHDGFNAKLALTADQVPVINAAFGREG